MGGLERKEVKMAYVKKCPYCGNTVIEKHVTEVVYGGQHTAFLNVRAGVCLHCGERLYTPDIIRLFEKTEEKLEKQELSGFQAVGQSFEPTLTA